MTTQNDPLPTLSRMVQGFLFRWLLLPALGMVLCFTGIWGVSKTHDFTRQQQFLSGSAGDYVQAGLNVCDAQMQQAAENLFQRYPFEAVLLDLSRNIYFITAYLLDPSGRTLHVMPRNAGNRDFSEMIRRPIPQKGFILTAPYYSRFAGRIVVGMVKPVSGNYLLLTELNLAYLQAVILDLNQRIHAGSAFMTDKYGNLLTHQDMSLVERQDNVGHLPILAQLETRPSISGYYREPEGLKLMSAVALPMGNWKLIIEQDAVDLFKPILAVLVLLLLGALGMYFLVFFLLNRQMQAVVVTPLNNFAKDIETVKQGDYHTEEISPMPPGTRGFTELAFLHDSFIEMQQVLRQREAALRQSDEVLDNTDAIAVFKDPHLAYLKVNQAYLRLTGYDDPDQVIGKTDADLFKDLATQDQIQTYMDNDRKALTLSPGQTLTIEEYLPGENGKTRTFLTKKFPVYNKSHDTLLGVATLSNEITDRKHTEEQLNQARKMDSVGRLAGGVAHDFNNMLGVILGHVEFALEKAEQDDGLNADLKEIQHAAQRSADLTKQLLTFARKQTIEPTPLDLNDTVESMLNMLRRLIGEHIDLAWRPASHMWSVKMDPTQVHQILANLCVNARDAISDVGRLTIETGTQTFDEDDCREHPGAIPGDFVLLAVSDTGCGMDRHTIDNLFEPFFTTKEMGKGTGLGLATIYGIVKQNNGFITVYSEPGQGSIFRIYLPRYVDDAAGTAAAVPREKSAAGGTETILLVEDDPAILRMTGMMLERKGYTVISAASPKEAIEKAKTHSGTIQLLMTDVVMPEMNGRDLADLIQTLCPDIQCLFMSGYTADIIAHRGVLDQGTHFIQKPFSIQDLADQVRGILDAKI